MSSLVDALVVSLAGGAGAALRFLADLAATRRWGPGQVRGIVAVNVVGALVAGLVVGVLAADSTGRLAALALLGGFTTFSAAMVHTLALVADGGGFARAAFHAVGTALGSVAAAALGLVLAGWIV